MSKQTQVCLKVLSGCRKGPAVERGDAGDRRQGDAVLPGATMLLAAEVDADGGYIDGDGVQAPLVVLHLFDPGF